MQVVAGNKTRILKMALDEVPSHEEAQAHTTAFDAMLDANEPCALLLIVPDNPQGASQKVIAHMRDWLESRREDIGDYCQGIAFVVNSRLLLMAWKPALSLRGEEFFGCPVRAFYKEYQAKEWLSEL